MSTDETAAGGFAPGRGDRLQRRCGLWVQLIATVSLVISLAVAGTAVSIGMARADGAPLARLR